MMDILAGSPYTALRLFLSIVTGFIASAVLCLLAAKLLASERMIQS